MAETFGLNVGEVLVLCRSAPRHRVGEEFDPVEDVARYSAQGNGMASSVGRMSRFADGLVGKGLFGRRGESYCLTERGEAVWKALVPGWQASRNASALSRREA